MKNFATLTRGKKELTRTHTYVREILRDMYIEKERGREGETVK